jgi:small subunit ribosomal protein S1
MTFDQNENLNPDPEKIETPEASEASPAEEVTAYDPLDDNDAGDDFASMLDSADQEVVAEAKPGDKLTGKIIQIGDHDSFVDCGLRNELPIATEELKADDGNLTFNVGDSITAHVQKGPDGLKLTLAVKGAANLHVLQQASESGTPVEGKIIETNKGGFSVLLGKTRAFCPYSQVALRRVEDPTEFVDQTFQFKILEMSEDGRNIVVSRRALLMAEREGMANSTRDNLKLGDVMDGEVTRLVPFGAFVDIGGVEGLVHISQISHQRVGDPSEVLAEGQSVQVKVLEIQNLGMDRSERISLSMKALAGDPWPETAASMEPGSDVEGKVTRLVDFGVFVELKPGVEGLIHISELANRRVVHPREVLNESDVISVRVLDVDLSRRRISLSRRQAGDYEDD